MKVVLKKNKSIFASAFTLMEVMVAVLVAGTALMALYASTFQSFSTLKSTRENLQATQVLMDKLEIIRLATWDQLTNTSLFPPKTNISWPALGKNFSFTTTYKLSDMPSDFSSLSYQSDMKLITLAIYWTNDVGTRSNEITTFVARYGLQRYIR